MATAPKGKFGVLKNSSTFVQQSPIGFSVLLLNCVMAGGLLFPKSPKGKFGVLKKVYLCSAKNKYHLCLTQYPP